MNVGDSYRDLGGGLYEVPDGEPVPSMGEAMQPRDDGPSCPGCGLRGDVSEVNHPEGRYYCGTCMTLFSAVQQEWSGSKGRKRRELAKRHREDGYKPLEVQRLDNGNGTNTGSEATSISRENVSAPAPDGTGPGPVEPAKEVRRGQR